MSNAEQASEPSMEDILSSIRKIIAEEPNDGDAPATATHDGVAADAADEGGGSAAEEASVAQPASEPVIQMLEPVAQSVQTIADVPGPVAELQGEDDGDDIAMDERGGAEIPQGGQPAISDTGNAQAVDNQGAATSSAFDTLLAASVAAGPSSTAASPAPTPTLGTAAQDIDAVLGAGSAETDGASFAKATEPQLSVPLPNLKGLSLGSPAAKAISADDSIDELMSLLDGEPSQPSASQETAGGGEFGSSPLVRDGGKSAMSSEAGDAGSAAAGGEQHDEGVEPTLPVPVSAFEAPVPKPTEDHGPLLSRMVTDAADSAGVGDAGSGDGGTSPGPEADADAAVQGQENDAESLNVDQVLDPSEAPGSVASAISASAISASDIGRSDIGAGDTGISDMTTGDGDAAPDVAVVDDAASEPVLSTLLQNMSAAAEPISTPDSTAALADGDTSAAGESRAGDSPAGDSGSSANVATAAALGALAAGIAAADATPAKGEPQDDGPVTDGPVTEGLATDGPATTPSAPPPSQIASLGALLASTPGSLTAQSDVDEGANVDGAAAADAAGAPTTDEAAKEPASGVAVAAVAPGDELQKSEMAAAKQLILPPAVGDIVPGSVKTMEDTVTELLRPMLRDWLDSNMPRIVEKALRVELASTIHSDVVGDADSSDD